MASKQGSDVPQQEQQQLLQHQEQGLEQEQLLQHQEQLQQLQQMQQMPSMCIMYTVARLQQKPLAGYGAAPPGI